MNIKYNFILNNIDEIIEYYGKCEKHDIRIIAAYDSFFYDLNLPMIIYDSADKEIDNRDLIRDKYIQITSVELSNDDYIIVSIFVRNKESYTEYDFELKSYPTFSDMYQDVSKMFSPFKHLFSRHIIRIYLEDQFAVIDNIRHNDLPSFDKVFDQGVSVVKINYFNSDRYANGDHILAVTVRAKRSEKGRAIDIFDRLSEKYKIYTGGLYKEGNYR